ncbi:alpha/beta hydrolase [Streptomyces sp. DSM 40750]|uniref:alpha/beta hydrolase n=1 Tax=Streptomyces sp. DSM 40750 TaxID=2801030 RepID=UPI00214C38C8|nr:alpha/beta hydrolase [Streptomyces sp. DSM 40750]UUU19955.1 alpha/beta hydrolase [Streptomyces sp. DSM 40750]
MRPRLVFVHGIGGPRDPVAELDIWLRALAEGARAAGHSRRVLDLVMGWAADARFAHYGHLFDLAQAQGGVLDGDDPESDFVGQLLLEAVDERLTEATADDEGQVLRHARAQLTQTGAAQGPGAVARRLLSVSNTLLSLPGLRTFGGWASAGVMVGQLRQVARYLRRGEADHEGATLDVRIRRCVEQALDPVGPTIVVAHSLGTVVSLETLHTHEGNVPLLVTLGSPIGLRTAVGARMRPQPLQVPGAVARWMNYWDRNDLITGGPRLERVVRPNDRSVIPVSRPVRSDGLWVHPAVKYLAQPAVAGPVVEAVETAALS